MWITPVLRIKSLSKSKLNAYNPKRLKRFLRLIPVQCTLRIKILIILNTRYLNKKKLFITVNMWARLTTKPYGQGKRVLFSYETEQPSGRNGLANKTPLSNNQFLFC